MASTDSDNEDDIPRVHLGFCIPIEDNEQLEQIGHRSPDYSKWDGGQIGGKPSWLHPRHLPQPLCCIHCERQMRFIGQLYAPIDKYDRAFHRSLYIFACHHCAKQAQQSVRVLRAQLPRENPYFPADTDLMEVNWTKHEPASHNQSLCIVCGMKATKKCPLQQEYFCGRQHQKEYKKCVYDRREDSQKPLCLPSVYSMMELVVEDEPDSADNAPARSETMFENRDDDSDQELEQDDLNQMTGAKSSLISQDPVTMHFYQRFKERPGTADQCLRYHRWADSSESPLWIRQDEQPCEIPPCPYCQAPRRFEFQVMPQMLHYLLKDRHTKDSRSYASVKEALQQADSLVNEAPPEAIPPSLVETRDAALQHIQQDLVGSNKEIDWGVIAVYTCTDSCGDVADDSDSQLGAYREEFAWKQPSLDV